MKNRNEIQPKKSLLEYSTEIGIILVSLGLLFLFKLTGNVFDGNTSEFDERILLWFRNPANLSDPIGPAWLEVVMRDITALGGLLFLGILTALVAGYLWLIQRQKLALFIALSIPAGSLLNAVLKSFFERSRPDIVPHDTAAALSSFPSGHAMMSAVVFLTLGTLLSLSTTDMRIKIYILCWSLLLTIMVGISRLYLGVHWPTDVIAGWIAGAVWATFSLLVYHRFIRTVG